MKLIRYYCPPPFCNRALDFGRSTLNTHLRLLISWNFDSSSCSCSGSPVTSGLSSVFPIIKNQTGRQRNLFVFYALHNGNSRHHNHRNLYLYDNFDNVLRHILFAWLLFCQFHLCLAIRLCNWYNSQYLRHTF